MSNSNVDTGTEEKVFLRGSDPQILTLEETAKILRVHRSTVSRYAMSGELRSYLIGNRRLFKQSDVWVFFENRIAPESQVDQGCVFGKEKVNGNCDYPKTQS